MGGHGHHRHDRSELGELMATSVDALERRLNQLQDDLVAGNYPQPSPIGPGRVRTGTIQAGTAFTGKIVFDAGTGVGDESYLGDGILSFYSDNSGEQIIQWAGVTKSGSRNTISSTTGTATSALTISSISAADGGEASATVTISAFEGSESGTGSITIAATDTAIGSTVSVITLAATRIVLDGQLRVDSGDSGTSGTGALPNPTKWLRIQSSGGTLYRIPAYQDTDTWTA